MSQKTPREKILDYKIIDNSNYIYGDTLEEGKALLLVLFFCNLPVLMFVVLQ